jgi:hypothetical protein
MLGKTSGIDSKMLKKDYSSKTIKKEKMALLNKSITVGASDVFDGDRKKKRKMKKIIKAKNEGEQSYKYSPVKRTVKKIGAKIEDKVDALKAGSMQRKAMRQAKRTGASDTCDPTKPKSCKTYSPTGTFKN